jgi:hypothetical protein
VIDLIEERKQNEEKRQARSEKYRIEYINHESGIRSLSLIYYGFGIILIANAAINLKFVEYMATCLIGGIISLFVGTGLVKIASWSRTAAAIIALYGMTAMNVWTLIFGYALYILFCEKGGFVFDESYQRSIKNTPEIQWKYTLLPIVMLALAVLVFAIQISQMRSYF